MTYKENIRAILECHFTGFKEDIIDSACNRILEQEPRWIPTSERYPRPDDEYKLFLVTDDKGKVSVQEFYLSLDEEPQPYFSGITNVVAWMPLPEPYKPQESEDEAIDQSMKVAIETMRKYQKIQEIVKKWDLDSWTDNLSYESMIQIREVLEDGNDD